MSDIHKVKTRFAPSPTGFLHLGGARTAIFSWAFAKHNNGTFVLRIEDTDLERSTPEAVQAILDGMEWLGIEYDEGPYYQTKRFDRYKEVIEELIKKVWHIIAIAHQKKLKKCERKLGLRVSNLNMMGHGDQRKEKHCHLYPKESSPS